MLADTIISYIIAYTMNTSVVIDRTTVICVHVSYHLQSSEANAII